MCCDNMAKAFSVGLLIFVDTVMPLELVSILGALVCEVVVLGDTL